MRFRHCGVLLAALLLTPAAAAVVDHDISFDPGTDFKALRTFSIGEGRTTSRYFQPEIDNRLFLQRMQGSIRAALVARGLKETTDRPDLTVTFQVTNADYATVERREPVRVPDSPGARGFMIPGGPEPQLFIAGTLVIDLTDVSGKLSEDARRLLSKFPPRRR